MQHSSRLRYVEADEVNSEVIDFDGLKVRTPDGDKLGDVDGFIVDRDARRAFYVVVDSGGWFSSRQFLVPIGHARIDADGDALVVDVTRDAISRYPEFDRDSIERLEGEDLRRYQARYDDACCPTDVSGHDHYVQPDWWRTEYYDWDAPASVGAVGTVPPSPPADLRPAATTGRDRDPANRSESTRRDADDMSPHLDGRAQPGDILGLETGGERTGLGETDKDEDKRRRDAEEAARKGRRS